NSTAIQGRRKDFPPVCAHSALASIAMMRSTSNGEQEATIMDVYEAVTSRRAVRGFKDEPVSREVLERLLSAAAWSPSGSNIHPWNIYVMTGAPLAHPKTPPVHP